MGRKNKNLFRCGQRYRCSVTGKVYTIEERPTNLGLRYLLVSMISGNIGTFKSAAFLNLQIEDRYLVRETTPLRELLAEIDRVD
jgi:transposase-like protein